MSWLAAYSNDEDDNDNLGVDWVLQYEFGDVGKSRGIPLAVCIYTNDPQIKPKLLQSFGR